MTPWLALALSGVATVASCDRASMDVQPKYEAYDPSPVWSDGASARPLVEGTVARGALERAAAVARPPPVTPALLARGRERYGIYCAPCHGLDGTGTGRVPQRGFPQPPSYLSERLKAAPAEHFMAVIADGFGVMYPYGDRVEPADRWAIVAYIRALQIAGGDEPAFSRPATLVAPTRAAPAGGDPAEAAP